MKSHHQSSSKSKNHKRQRSAAKSNYFDELSSMTKSKLGELLLTVAEEELKIE